MARLSCIDVVMIFSLSLMIMSSELAIRSEGLSDYRTALAKSLLYFEAQRSGKLPPNQRVQWRGDSALKDGGDAGIDLTGGYYDAGDNVKFGFPMAFTISMLSWSVVEFSEELQAKGELSNALDAIRWGTDYLIKAHPQPDVLYAEVGDGDSDHSCWERPEDMTTPRTTFRIDNQQPGADLAGETAAALAAASIAFAQTDSNYSAQLLTHAEQLFDFARNNLGLYQDSIPVVAKFYKSSGYQDELVWAAAWLYHATGYEEYLTYLSKSDNGGARTEFSWNDKYVGAQVLIAKLVLEGKVEDSPPWAYYKDRAEQFICNCLQQGDNNFHMTPGGLLWFQTWNNLQYTTAAAFINAVYGKYLYPSVGDVQCSGGSPSCTDLIAFAQAQADYILGANPNNISYMVGYGSNYPNHVHHRGASIVSIKNDSTPVSCKQGYDLWFNRNASDPNVLHGALVGGPDGHDWYKDTRSNYQMAEPATANAAPFVGVLAFLE